jgi:hypothetical protein
MTQPTISTDYSELLKIIGGYLNWGRSGWPAATEELIDELVKSAYRWYVNAQSFDGTETGHRWTWLTPTRTITTVAEQGDYDLPEDFGAFNGPLTWSSASGNSRIEIPFVGEGMIRAARQGNTTTGRPIRVAERIKAPNAIHGQRWEILFDPIPDDAYVFSYSSSVVPQKLDATNKYPLGGAQYSELLIAACLAVAESRYRPQEQDKRTEYSRALSAAIAVDSRNVPDHLGSMSRGFGSRGGRSRGGRRITSGNFYYNGNLIG